MTGILVRAIAGDKWLAGRRAKADRATALGQQAPSTVWTPPDRTYPGADADRSQNSNRMPAASAFIPPSSAMSPKPFER